MEAFDTIRNVGISRWEEQTTFVRKGNTLPARKLPKEYTYEPLKKDVFLPFSSKKRLRGGQSWKRRTTKHKPFFSQKKLAQKMRKYSHFKFATK